MADCVRCPCGQFLDRDEQAACPACGRRLARVRPDGAGFRVVLVVAGFLAVVTAGLLGAAVARRSPAPSAAPAVEVVALVPALPVEPPPPPADPILEPPAPVPPPVPEPPRVTRPVVVGPRAGVIEAVIVPPAGRYKVGETIQQDVVVTRRSGFRLLGLEVSQGVQYALSSQVVVTAVNPDGSLVAGQTVTAARLLDADPDVRAEFAAALEKVPGTKFELTVGPAGDVTAITGVKDPIRVKPGKLGDFQSLRVGSVLDADGWKELAGLMFFQPGEPLRAGAKWEKPFAHDWGELGSWRGKTNFADRGRLWARSPLEQIVYTHAIEYGPPADGGGRELPFRIRKADLKAAAGGAFHYDTARDRNTAAEENFYVRGSLTVVVAGPDVMIELEERQNFKLTFTEPAKGELVGKPPKK